ncbi:OmpA family protein [Parapedobacter sp. DT-150]|uniref:OmpA family protein n=1 Tax=Parapedobacter sp. DT-150 TaxID=3396162 RepID=UPI003F19AFED
MMKLRTSLAGILALMTMVSPAHAQLLKKLAKKAERAAERTIERRVERETETKTDEALDKVFDGRTGKSDEKDGPAAGGKDEAGGQPAESTMAATKTFASYGKFDFVPGERVIAVEDFLQDAVGDFPAKWNTDASGEIKTIEGLEGRWLALTTKGSVFPEFIRDLPENFTLEFDLAVTPGYSYYDTDLMISLAHLAAPKDFAGWGHYGAGKTSGVAIFLHPQDAGSEPRGRSNYAVWVNRAKTMDNEMGALEAFNNRDKNVVKVSIWRQQQRLRFYVDETKIWDLPRAFDPSVNYNGLVFSRQNAKNDSEYLISNIRLAVGAPDTRSKLLTEGKFSTTGIYFNTGSATIKPQSYGVLKEIAAVLKENPTVNVFIIGHTDSDGGDDLNLTLSKDRAASVKQALMMEFGIDGSRMDTDGRGEGEPIGDNGTPEGKAQNRRVEFVKK